MNSDIKLVSKNDNFEARFVSINHYIILKITADTTLNIADVSWNNYTSECDLYFNGSSLQDNIVTHEIYCEFIQILDTIYDKMYSDHHKLISFSLGD